jgi:Family of unknown function (DUF5706)
MAEESVVSQIAQRLLDDARAELIHADDKASSALGAVGALVAVVAVAPSGPQTCGDVVAWVWVGGLSICLLAIVLLMLAALPRFTMGSRQDVLAYFGDVSQIRHERDFCHISGKLTENSRETILSELRTINKVVLTKYRYIRLGILCVVAGCVLIVLSAL